MSLLVLFVAGCVRNVRRRDWFLSVPVALGMIAAMTFALNVGVRHILALYPFVILIAAGALAGLRAHWRAAFVATALLESALIWPHDLAFFNGFVGGPRNGHLILADSNLDWGQDLKQLKPWMQQHGVAHINLSYFGTADPAYYGIDCAYLPGSPIFAEDRVTPPRLPGYVAISLNNLLGLYAPHPGESLYKEFRDQQPVAVLGYSLYIYEVR